MDMTEFGSDTITGIRSRLYTTLMAGMGVKRVYQQALVLLKPKAHERILDVGCGTGTFLKLFRDNSGVLLQLFGIDASEDMLQEARKNANTISFQCADAAALPFDNESFDAVVSILALHHMSKDVKKRAIGETVRVLKKDGRIVILDLFRPKGRWEKCFQFWFNLHSYTRGNWAAIRGELKQNGLRVTDEGTVRGFVGYLVAKRLRGN